MVLVERGMADDGTGTGPGEANVRVSARSVSSTLHNAASTTLRSADLLRFVRALGYEPIVALLPEAPVDGSATNDNPG